MTTELEHRGRKASIAVVGGGITGIAAAMELAETGVFEVTLFEKQDKLGGLSGYFQWGDVIWDRFYHVILSTDSGMIEFLNKLRLENEFFWRKTMTGFYGDGKLISLSSTLDFIRFPFMTLWQKFRLGLGILYCARIKDPRKLDRIYVREWLTKIFGRRVYENIWDPLLRSKLGSASQRTSAAFIWATINRLYGNRNSKNKIEMMGHVHGGYRTILKAAERVLSECDVNVLMNHSVEKITSDDSSIGPDKSSWLPKLNLYANNRAFKFHNVLLTIDCPGVLRIMGDQLDSLYRDRLARVEYLGIICVVLILKRRLSPYYVINLLDDQLPFTGIIEATNVVVSDEVSAKHLVYLLKYVSANDPMNDDDDEAIKTLFISNLKKVFPGLNDIDILYADVNREPHVQPVQDLNYFDQTLYMRKPLKNVYISNNSMIYNSTLNNNAAIDLAQKVIEIVKQDCGHLFSKRYP